jgi:hypothetical protein
MRALRALAIFAAVVGWWAAITLIRGRFSLFYLAIAAALVLPVASWFRVNVNRLALGFVAIAFVLALSPVDFMTRRTGSWSLELLPVSHDYARKPGTACYGCIVQESDPTLALVLGY